MKERKLLRKEATVDLFFVFVVQGGREAWAGG